MSLTKNNLNIILETTTHFKTVKTLKFKRN